MENHRYLTEEEIIKKTNEIMYKYDENFDSTLEYDDIMKYLSENDMYRNIDHKQVFKKMDTDHNLKVGITELRAYFRNNIKRIIGKNGYIVRNYKKRPLTEEESEKKVNEVFYQYDRNYNGVLELHEIRLYLMEMKIFNNYNIENIIRKMDINQDGRIGRMELKIFFLKYLTKEQDL